MKFFVFDSGDEIEVHCSNCNQLLTFGRYYIATEDQLYIIKEPHFKCWLCGLDQDIPKLFRNKNLAKKFADFFSQSQFVVKFFIMLNTY